MEALLNEETGAILLSQSNETTAMLLSQTNPVGVELFSYVNTFFCSTNFEWLLDMRVKTALLAYAKAASLSKVTVR